MSIKNILLVSLCAFLLNACGFHLKGNLPLPESLNVLKLQVPKGEFKDALSDALVNAGGTLVESASSAEATLKIVDYSTKRQVGTLDDRGKANSYRVVLTVEYELLTPDGKLYRNSTLRERRTYDYDPINVIQSEQEEMELIEAMDEEIALKVLRQLATMMDYPNKPNKK